jgi:hypothetical protein
MWEEDVRFRQVCVRFDRSLPIPIVVWRLVLGVGRCNADYQNIGRGG